MKKTVYYAHFMGIYNTPQEKRDMATLEALGFDVFNPNQPYIQQEVKDALEINLDLSIVGFNYGTGKNVDVISSLQCESSDGLVKTAPTGIKEDMMQHITENQDELLGSVLEVKCSGLSQARDGNYSLLHPVFKLLRDDKDTSDSLEDIKAIELAAKTLL